MVFRAAKSSEATALILLALLLLKMEKHEVLLTCIAMAEPWGLSLRLMKWGFRNSAGSPSGPTFFFCGGPIIF